MIRGPTDHLTEGEISCLLALHASGASRKFIARKMGVSTRTVRLHVPKLRKPRKVYEPLVIRVHMDGGDIKWPIG